MTDRLHVATRPCPSCPYRRDVPSGVWAPEEYAKLPAYDRQSGEMGELATFHCHQENATGRSSVCVGWLGCHSFDSTAVRLAVAMGLLAVEDVARAEATDVPLWGSGAEAFRHGMTDIARPSPEAQALQDKLYRRGAARG